MPTTTATIGLSSDTGDSSITINNTMTLWKAASGTEGMDTMTSVSKILSSTNQVDLAEYKQNDPIAKRRIKLNTILQERQDLINQLQVLKNG